jgi:signal transduction histidine kinase/CheY-like chemotaxis protein
VFLADGELARLDQWAVPRALRGETVGNAEYTLRRKDTGETWIGSYSFAPIRDKQGKIVGSVVTARDITDRKRAEQERLELQRSMLHAQKLESLGVLAGGIAHDFNNLLAGIMGYADLALLGLPDGEPAREDIEVIRKTVRRAADLTRQMLAYSGKGKFLVEAVDLSRVVEESKKILAMSVSKKATVTYNLAADLPAVQADAAQMCQVLMNLVINASEALGERGGTIAVSTSATGRDAADRARMAIGEDLPEGLYVCLEVADTGSGMSKETQQRIFDPFFTTKFTGRGLGLAALDGIVRGHKGAIRLSSELGVGTTFRVFFPASGALIAAPAREPAAASERASGMVLVVDDEELVRTLARRMLESAGLSVLTAGGWREAVRLLGEHPDQVGCVLLDLTMPDLDGAETLRELRRIRADLPVVLSSGCNEEAATEQFAGTEPAGFVQKPYELEVLLAQVRRALRKR